MKNEAMMRSNLWHIIGTLEGLADAVEDITVCEQRQVLLVESLRTCVTKLKKISVEVFQDE